MRRLVIDTNVLVSAAIGGSYPYFIICAIFLDKNIELCISDEVMQEYQNVLMRDKFCRYPDFTVRAENLIVSIDTYSRVFIPEVRLTILKDPDDNKFLELAAACNADYLITGNIKDFTMSSFGPTRIVTPKEYWEDCR